MMFGFGLGPTFGGAPSNPGSAASGLIQTVAAGRDGSLAAIEWRFSEKAALSKWKMSSRELSESSGENRIAADLAEFFDRSY